MQTIRDLGFELLEHAPPYSPDLTPFVYHVLLQMKKSLSNEEIIEAVEAWITEQETKMFLKVKRRFNKYIEINRSVCSISKHSDFQIFFYTLRWNNRHY